MTEPLKISDKIWLNDPNENQLFGSFGNYVQIPWYKRLWMGITSLRIEYDAPRKKFIPKKIVGGDKYKHLWMDEIMEDPNGLHEI